MMAAASLPDAVHPVRSCFSRPLLRGVPRQFLTRVSIRAIRVAPQQMPGRHAQAMADLLLFIHHHRGTGSDDLMGEAVVSGARDDGQARRQAADLVDHRGDRLVIRRRHHHRNRVAHAQVIEEIAIARIADHRRQPAVPRQLRVGGLEIDHPIR